MYLNKFQQGDEVQYAGNKDELNANLNGRRGVVVGRVAGETGAVVVDFGPEQEAGAYIMDERTQIEKYVRRAQAERTDAKTDVQKRHPGGKPGGKGKPGQGGKRKNDQEAK